MSKLFVVWSDYDCCGCQNFLDRNDEARAFVTEIMRKQDEKKNGTHLLAVIEGDELVPEIIQRVNDVRFKDKEAE